MRPQNVFASPVLGWKNVKKFGFKGHEIISLPEEPNCYPAWGTHTSWAGHPIIQPHLQVFFNTFFLVMCNAAM